MTRYEYLRRIAEILVPKKVEEFYNYLLHSCDDDGGFLRTRYCYWEKPVSDDSSRDYQVRFTLITLQKEYDFDNLPEFYDSNGHTNIKLQIFFGDYENDDEFYLESEWASSVGYSYPVKIDIEKGTYEISEFVYDKSRHYKIGQPKYSLGDFVRFHLLDSKGNHKFKDGTILVVDAFGTIEQQEEPSYDIEIIDDSGKCLYKHIRESDISFRHGHKNLKDYISI